jgi:UDP-N-acetylglucosamine--N-acetylmuramyl-(pentapeptide) pyrophosphoryl-undecaprenol N-acetylglucosamine transferase
MPRVIIAAGGTGGHFYPGLVLGQELRRRGCKIGFICRKNDSCKALLASSKFRFFEIAFHGFPRKPTLRLFSFIFLLVRSFFSARAVIKAFRPDVVVGMGGYISFPVVLAARVKGIPVVIHEQNCLPGLANRALSVFASKIAVSFEESEKYFPKAKTIFTGNPVRPELFTGHPEETYAGLGLSREKVTVFVFGGSQGAVKLNHTVLQTIPHLGEYKSRVQFIHLTGRIKNEKEKAEEGYKKLGVKAAVFEYLENIGQAYSAADVIISRAGATTVSELTVLHKPAILVPFPHATGNHQEYNALNLVRKGNAIMIREKDLSPAILAGGLILYIASVRKTAHKVNLPKHLPQYYLANTVLEFVK